MMDIMVKKTVSGKAARDPPTRGSALIAVLLAVLLFGSLGTTVASLTANNLSSSTQDYQGSQSFYIGEGGMQWVIMNRLAGDSNFSDNVPPTDPPFGPNSISLGPGHFWVEYLNPQSSQVKVRITSRVDNAVRVVEQQAGQTAAGPQYVTMAGGNVAINGSGHIYGDVALKGNINVDGVQVHGNIYKDPTLTLPTLDFNVYKNMCNTIQNGNADIGSGTYNGKLCMTGNITVRGNTTVNGLLYAGGNITINGSYVIINGTMISRKNIGIGPSSATGLQFNSQPIAGGGHMPALAASGNISLKNSNQMQIQGMMWSGGNVDLSNSGFLRFTGSFITSGNMTLQSMYDLLLTFSSEMLVGIPGMSGNTGSSSTALSLSGWQTYAPWW